MSVKIRCTVGPSCSAFEISASIAPGMRSENAVMAGIQALSVAVAPSTMRFSDGRKPVPMVMAAVLRLPLNFSTDPLRLSSRFSATSAAVTFPIAAAISAKPAAPFFVSTAAARTASDPNSVSIVARRC